MDETDGTTPERAWLPDDALAAVTTERTINPDETEELRARRILNENSSVVAMSIVHIALHGQSERTRLDAGKYVLERVLGRVGDDAFGGEKSPVAQFMDDVVEYVHANDTGPQE